MALTDKLTNIANGFRESRGLTEELSLDEMAELAATPIPSGSGKLPQIIDRTVTELTAEDFAGMTSIGPSAFRDCKNLTNVTLGNKITRLGEEAFTRCAKLLEITIPNNVTSFGLGCFEGCSKLNRVNIFDLDVWCHIDLDYYATILYYEYTNPVGMAKGKLYLNGTLVTELVLDGSKEVKRGVFAYNKELKRLVISGNPTLGNAVFAFSGLENVDLGTELIEIKPQSFFRCENLTSITIPNSITSIGSNAFAYCTGLTSVNIPNSVTSLGSYIFDHCTNLISVTIGDSVTRIEQNTFDNCSNLTSVTIPDNVTFIGQNTFKGCSNLTETRIGNGIEIIASNAFQNCTALTDIYIDKPEGSVSNAPWGATNATIHWNTPLPSEEE